VSVGHGLWSIALDATRVYWAEAGGTPPNAHIASAAKDGTGVMTLISIPSCGPSVLLLSANTFFCAKGDRVLKTSLTTGVTTTIATYPDLPVWIVADAQGAFLLTYGWKYEGEDIPVTAWSSLIDLSTGEEIPHAGFTTGAATMDANYVYWAPFDRMNPGLYRVRRSR
jgi:hypothetical protein